MNARRSRWPRWPRRPGPSRWPGLSGWVPLRMQVLAGVLSITLVALAAFDLAAVTALRGYLFSQTDTRLAMVLSITGPALARQVPASGSVSSVVGKQTLAVQGEYDIAFVPRNGPAVALQASPGTSAQLPKNVHAIASGQSAVTVEAAGGATPYRVRAVHADGGTLVASTSLTSLNSTVGRLELILGVGSGAAVLLIFLGTGLVMRRGLRPVETMAAQADRITAGDLTERVSLQRARSEVGRLGAALNGMLARIEAGVREREASQELTRRFFADASHELRTPLASLRANAELYQQGALRRRAQVDEAMRRIALEAQRMSGLVDDMLRLARLDQHPGQQREPVDVGALVTACTERARVADPLRTWRTCVDAGLVAAGDEELLRRAIDNLLVNVQAHTPPGTAATITAAGRGREVVVEVSDEGPGVPADRLPRIFDRFYRAGARPDRPGSGLGLAIVTAIAAAHEGTAEAALNYPHGLRVTLTVPAWAEPARPGGPPSSRPAQPPATGAVRPH
jgi:two-component system, OmpR family, sensor kinase